MYGCFHNLAVLLCTALGLYHCPALGFHSNCISIIHAIHSSLDPMVCASIPNCFIMHYVFWALLKDLCFPETNHELGGAVFRGVVARDRGTLGHIALCQCGREQGASPSQTPPTRWELEAAQKPCSSSEWYLHPECCLQCFHRC